MKKIVSMLLVALMGVSAVTAKTTSNMTHLTVRNINSTLAHSELAAYVPGSHKKGDKFGLSLDVTGFYQGTDNSKDLATWFGGGYSGSATQAQDGTIQVVQTEPTLHSPEGTTTNALYGRDIEYMPKYKQPGDTDAPMAGTVRFNPTRESYGAKIGIRQQFDDAVPGMHLGISALVTEVTHDLGVTYSSEVASVNTDATTINGKNVSAYFNGEVSATGKQDALAYGKFNSKKMTESGIGEVTVSAGYTFLDTEKTNICTQAELSIPTGNHRKGVYVFEPTTGNEDHFGLGAGIKACTQVWEHEKTGVKAHMFAAANYQYLFEAREKRMLGIWDVDNKRTLAAGPYRRMMQDGVAGTLPAANALLQEVNVTPGSNFDGLLGASVCYKGFTVKAGYNLHLRREEKVELATPWAENKYAFADYKYDAGTADALKTGNPISNTTEHANRIGGTTFFSQYLEKLGFERETANTNYSATTDYQDTIGSVQRGAGFVNRIGKGDHTTLDGTTNPTKVNADSAMVAIIGDSVGKLGPVKGDPQNVVDAKSYANAVSFGGPINQENSAANSTLNNLVLIASEKWASPKLGVEAVVVARNGYADDNGGGAAANVAKADSAQTSHYTISTKPCTMPHQITHSVFGSLNYAFDTLKVRGHSLPLGLAAGGMYEFANDNGSVQNWNVYGKLSIGF